MKSIYSRIALWSFGTLLLSWVAFVAISIGVASGHFHRGSPMQRLHRAVLEDARDAYNAGGKEQLARWLQRYREITQTETYLTDAAGRDLLTGEDRSSLLQQRWRGLPLAGGRLVANVFSRDEQWRLLFLPSPPIPLWSLAPYYLLVLLAVAALCWLLAVYLAAPLRLLSHAVDRFGRGDLDARAKLHRRDEIGELARVFDTMAGRIQTLLTAERRLLQDIAHELRSPLARLSFAAELLDSPGERTAAIAQVRKDIDRFAALVGSLMEMTRAEGDPDTRRRDAVDLAALLEAIAADARVEAGAKNAAVRVACSGEALAEGDAELLRRAVENVLRNAVYYTAPGTRVEVALTTRDGYHEIAVRDYGPGVPESQLGEIFAPFFRVDPSRNASTGGVGLGLAIARRAVTLHHGEIRAYNANPGLCLVLRLPRVAAVSEATALQ